MRRKQAAQTRKVIWLKKEAIKAEKRKRKENSARTVKNDMAKRSSDKSRAKE